MILDERFCRDRAAETRRLAENLSAVEASILLQDEIALVETALAVARRALIELVELAELPVEFMGSA